MVDPAIGLWRAMAAFWVCGLSGECDFVVEFVAELEVISTSGYVFVVRCASGYVAICETDRIPESDSDDLGVEVAWGSC
jgi:hypothetical protein